MDLPISQHGGRVGQAVQSLLNSAFRAAARRLGWQLDSVSSISSLASIPDDRIPDGSSKLVLSVGDSFTLYKDSSEATDGITVVPTRSGNGRWLRDLNPSASWSRQTSWSIHAIDGDDENVGSPQAPIKTFAEFVRRVRTPMANTTISVSDLPSDDPIDLQMGGAELTIESLSTPIYQGQVQAYTRNPAANEIGSLTDSNWTASNYLFQHVRFTSGDSEGNGGWLLQDLGAGAARMSAISALAWGYTPLAPAPNPGDDFVVESFSTVTIKNIQYDGTLRLSRLRDSEFGSNYVKFVTATLLYVRACAIDFYPSGGNAFFTDVMGTVFPSTTSAYFYGGAFAHVFCTTASETAAHGPPMTIHEAIPTASHDSTLTLNNGCTALFYTDVYLYGAPGTRAVDLYEASSAWLSSSTVFRGNTSATYLVQLRMGSRLKASPSGHTINEKTLWMSESDVEVEISQVPISDPHSGVQVNSSSDTSGGVVGVARAGIDGAITAGTVYALPGYTESPTERLAHVVTNRSILRNLFVTLDTAPGGTDSVTVSLLVNGAFSGVSCVITGSQTSASDPTNWILVEPEDKVTFEVQKTGVLAADLSISVETG